MARSTRIPSGYAACGVLAALALGIPAQATGAMTTYHGKQAEFTVEDGRVVYTFQPAFVAKCDDGTTKRFSGGGGKSLLNAPIKKKGKKHVKTFSGTATRVHFWVITTSVRGTFRDDMSKAKGTFHVIADGRPSHYPLCESKTVHWTAKKQASAKTEVPTAARAGCVASRSNPRSPRGYSDKTDPADAGKYRKPTVARVKGVWDLLPGASLTFTAKKGCTYTTRQGGAGRWHIKGNYVVFTGPLAGYCNGHGRLVKRSSLQMDFYCDTPGGTNYFAFSK